MSLLPSKKERELLAAKAAARIAQEAADTAQLEAERQEQRERAEKVQYEQNVKNGIEDVKAGILQSCNNNLKYACVQLINNSSGIIPNWAHEVVRRIESPDYNLGLRTVQGTYTTYRSYGCDGDYESEEHKCSDLVLDVNWD